MTDDNIIDLNDVRMARHAQELIRAETEEHIHSVITQVARLHDPPKSDDWIRAKTAITCDAIIGMATPVATSQKPIKIRADVADIDRINDELSEWRTELITHCQKEFAARLVGLLKP